MKQIIKRLGAKETAVIISLLLIFTAGLVLKYSSWKKPERFDYGAADRQFEEKTKADFEELRERQISGLQQERAAEIKKLADSLNAVFNKDDDKLLYPGTSVNINTGYAAELMKLPGIGEVMAERIIEYRENAGGFKRIEDIMNVKGIGRKKFEKIKPYITVE